MADLKKRLAPLEGIEMPDRWSEIQRRAPRAGFDPEPPRRQPIVAIALAIVLSIVTVGWLASAFRSEPQVVDEPTPTVADPSPPSPEPDPTVEPEPEPRLDPDAVDLGLGFGICGAESLAGRFATGESTKVWFGPRTHDETLRCQRSPHHFAFAVDIGGDRQAEAWIDPFGRYGCYFVCGLTGLVDLDDDGTDEVVLLAEGGTIPTFVVIDVAENGKPATVGFVEGSSDRGAPGTGAAEFRVGGDEAYSYAVSCETGVEGSVITQHSVAGIVDAPQLGATVNTTELRLTPEGFVILSDVVLTEVDPPPVLPRASSLCGLALPHG